MNPLGFSYQNLSIDIQIETIIMTSNIFCDVRLRKWTSGFGKCSFMHRPSLVGGSIVKICAFVCSATVLFIHGWMLDGDSNKSTFGHGKV